jgi:hypothetical protein
MSKQEHPDLSDVEWDPSGRYVTSYVNLYSAKVSELDLICNNNFVCLISVIIHLKYGHFKAVLYLKREWKG